MENNSPFSILNSNKNRATILLVEDNPNIMDVNRETLLLEGYRVLEAETISEGRTLFVKEAPDLIILDILLPDGNGLQLCEELRGDSNVPILFVTALGHDKDIIAGLQAGGDDYLPKPYDIDVLVTRVKALLRRASNVPDTITKGSILLKIPSSEVFIDGDAIRLPQNEFSLLRIFMQNEDKVFTEEYLYEKVWGQPMSDDNQALTVVISRLRKKIAPAFYDIEKVRGKGYVFLKG